MSDDGMMRFIRGFYVSACVNCTCAFLILIGIILEIKLGVFIPTLWPVIVILAFAYETSIPNNALEYSLIRFIPIKIGT